MPTIYHDLKHPRKISQIADERLLVMVQAVELSGTLSKQIQMDGFAE